MSWSSKSWEIPFAAGLTGTWSIEVRDEVPLVGGGVGLVVEEGCLSSGPVRVGTIASSLSSRID